MTSTTTIDSLLTRTGQGAPSAADTLFTTLYNELHRLAQRELGRQQGRGLLGVTTLLHEAYLAMANRDGADFPDRARFIAYAARVMRGLIIDALRGRLAQKRGGGLDQITLPDDFAPCVADAMSLQRLSDALDGLEKHNPSLAEIVHLRFFCGFSIEEVAVLRGVSERTVRRGWEKGRLYLRRELSAGAPA